MLLAIGSPLEIVGAIAGVVVMLWLIVRFINKDAASSFLHLFRTQVGKTGRYAEGIDPASQMRQAAIDAGKELHAADQALELNLQLKGRLTRQIESDQAQVGKLRAALSKLLAEGKSDTDPAVLERAKRVAALEAAITENKSQISSQQDLYDNTLKRANSAAVRIKNTMAEADQLKVKLDLQAQTAKLVETFEQYDPTRIDGHLSTIDKYRQAALSAGDGYAARLQIAKDRSAALGDDFDADESAVPDEAAKVLASLRGNGVPVNSN